MLTHLPVSDDERLHPGDGSQFWTETSWWGFANADQPLGGWVYVICRPELGVAAAGIWVHDGEYLAPWLQPYHRHYFHLPLPPDGDLDRLDLLGGLSIHCLDPFRRHSIHYEDDPEIRLELEFSSAGPARSLAPPGSPRGHLDQPLWASGVIDLGGRHIAIDGPAARDRSWGDRPDVGQTAHRRKDSYAWGGGTDGSFQVATVLDAQGTKSEICFGAILLGDKTCEIVSSHRRVTERSQDGSPRRIVLTLTDSTGREHRINGTVHSAVALTTLPGLLTFGTLVRWNLDSHVWWGEDQEKWPTARFRREVMTGSPPEWMS